MKKSMLALAVLGSFAGVAAAQSSVTLFGVVDLSVLSVSNSGGTQKLMQNNSYNSNRLGFRGVEDLGGGMKASFWLEAGMGNDTGAIGSLAPATAPTSGVQGNTKMFNRRSTVSLAGNFGEIRLGRDYTPQFWTTTIYDAFGTNGPGSSLNVSLGGINALGSGAGTFVRADNSVGYFLPANLGGLFGQIQVSGAEGVANTNNQNKHTSVRLGYAAGPVSVAFATGKTKPITGFGGAEFKMTNLGASFDAGVMKVMGYVNDSKTSTRKERLMHLGASVPMGAAELRLGYTKSDNSGTGFDTADATQFAVGVVYNLSKRTAVYGDYSRISNKAGGTFNVLGSGNNTAGASSRGIDVGVRHAF